MTLAIKPRRVVGLTRRARHRELSVRSTNRIDDQARLGIRMMMSTAPARPRIRVRVDRSNTASVHFGDVLSAHVLLCEQGDLRPRAMVIMMCYARPISIAASSCRQAHPASCARTGGLARALRGCTQGVHMHLARTGIGGRSPTAAMVAGEPIAVPGQRRVQWQVRGAAGSERGSVSAGG